MRIIKLAGLFLAVVLASPQETQAQSLSDVARKEKDRQAKARAAGSKAKVYTELPADPAAPKSSETAEAVEAPASTGDAAQAKASPADGPAGNIRPTPVPTELIGTWPLKARPAERPSARAHRTVNVTIYVTSWCRYCRKAREFLARQPNVRVVAYDIEENRTRHAEMLSKTSGDKGVPVIDVEGIVLQGYSAEALTEAISAVRAR